MAQEQKRREPSVKDFTVQVKGVGNFVFARRSLADEISIQVEYSRITQGVPSPTLALFTLALAMATIRVLMVECPDGWDMDALDPLDDDEFEQIERVFTALRAKEDTFRKRPRAGSQEVGAGNGQDNGVLGQEEVQPPAERPALSGADATGNQD